MVRVADGSMSDLQIRAGGPIYSENPVRMEAGGGVVPRRVEATNFVHFAPGFQSIPRM